MIPFSSSFLFFFLVVVTCLHACVCFNFDFPFVAVTHSRLNNALLDRVHQANCFPDRSFHSLMTLHRLARWVLSPESSEEALSYETTTHRSKFPIPFIIIYYFILSIHSKC